MVESILLLITLSKKEIHLTHYDLFKELCTYLTYLIDNNYHSVLFLSYFGKINNLFNSPDRKKTQLRH